MADQLVDQLKQNNPSMISNLKVAEPYFNECILAAERMKNNRRSERDRQICYENLILAEKLERIKNQSGQNAKKNLEKDYRNHCRLLTSKAIKSINKRLMIKQSVSSHETEIISYHSPSLTDTSSSENEDDQATAADVDTSMEYSDAISPVLHKKRNHCVQSISTRCREMDSSKNARVYQHLTNIDMTMIRDASPLVISQPSRHFSICILPHFDSDLIKSRNNRQCAFKKEILYY
jgi:hypothetical protein